MPLPPAAPVTIFAPAPAEVRSLRTWYAHTIPAALRPVQPITVRVLTPDEMRDYLRGAGSDDADADSDLDDVDGTFDTEPDRITLRQNANGQPDLWTFAHELGHAVWAHVLSHTEQNEYTDIYDRQKATHHLVTRYATQDVEEGFAEAYSFYVCGPPMLAARDPLSFQFLRRQASARP